MAKLNLMFFLITGLIALTLFIFGVRLIFNHHRPLKTLRVLFPSWRFFENITPIPRIYYRRQSNQYAEASWMELRPYSAPRQFHHLFHNPEGNLEITYQVQLEQLLNDIATTFCQSEDSIEELTSFKIVSALIQNRVRALHPEGIESFQFKIGAFEFTSRNQVPQDPQWSESLIVTRGKA